MKTWFLILLMIIARPLYGQEDEEVKHAVSTDGKFLAATREISDEGYVWRRDLDRFRLVIWPQIHGIDLGDKYLRWDCDQRRVVCAIGWSPDSKFLVITTASSGGHSPWHFDSYLFCTSDRTVRYMDDTIGLVVKPNFKYIGSHFVSMSFGPDFDNPAVRRVDLEKEAPKMKIEATLKYIPYD